MLVPPGKYLTGTVFLKSNVNLHVASTATILGSTDLTHYATDIEPCGFVTAAHINKCLLYAADAENISLTGAGVIDGQGGSFASAAPDGTAGERPMLIRLVRCSAIVARRTDAPECRGVVHALPALLARACAWHYDPEPRSITTMASI